MVFLREFSVMLEIKACDLRKSLYIQSHNSIDKGIHIGGAQSAVTPLTALFYGGQFRYDVENPTTADQDIFILSKGHAVSALAAVYADVGYIPESALYGSRGWGALVKGHPGPNMPGVQVATGPLGQGIGIACGFALRQKELGDFRTYTLVGDGELQEGFCWESMLFAAQHKLDNLCIIVDKNNGQSDDVNKLLVNLDDMSDKFEAFGFRVLYTDARNMQQFINCLEEFNLCSHCSKPTVIICESYKGFGGFSSSGAKHKGNPDDDECEQENCFLTSKREMLIKSLNHMDLDAVAYYAKALSYNAEYSSGKLISLTHVSKSMHIKRAGRREKKLRYNKDKLPSIELGQFFAPTDLGIAFSRVFAQDLNFYTIDADLSNISGLYTGTALTNRTHAINAGIAECNMMNMAEGLAAMGANVWVSTFGPFFNMQAFRRICVSYHDRLEAIENANGWLTEGHNLDITFLSTAANLDGAVNGATHISNDDINTIGQLAHVKIIDTSCPQQFLAVAKWIAEGNKGLVYLRIVRNASPALYDQDYCFEYGKGYILTGNEMADVIIVSSGHGVSECLNAANILKNDGISVAIVDMPCYDSALLKNLAEKGKKILFAEQNNGWLFDCFSRDFVKNNFKCDSRNIHQLSTRDTHDEMQFIQSGTYEQLIEVLGLCSKSIVDFVKFNIKGR